MEKDYCQDCKREKGHGGDCGGKHDYKSCLFYEEDPRGEIRWKDIALHWPFGSPLPDKEKWIETVSKDAFQKPDLISLRRIESVEWWYETRGLMGVIIHCECRCFHKETTESIDCPEDGKALRLVK